MSFAQRWKKGAKTKKQKNQLFNVNEYNRENNLLQVRKNLEYEKNRTNGVEYAKSKN